MGLLFSGDEERIILIVQKQNEFLEKNKKIFLDYKKRKETDFTSIKHKMEVYEGLLEKITDQYDPDIIFEIYRQKHNLKDIEDAQKHMMIKFHEYAESQKEKK